MAAGCQAAGCQAAGRRAAGRRVAGRRAALALVALAAAGAAATRGDAQGTAASEDALEWAVFRARYVRPEGRVVDTRAGGISHSEGQGWAMLCAERFDDQPRFDAIWTWTRRVLGRPDDALFHWRFRPDGAGSGGVDDPNNATDGDLMIAWALLNAAERWREPAYAEAGIAIARDVLRLLLRQVGTDVVLLPGASGFERSDHVVINLSYYAFPAFRPLARAVPDPVWLRIAADGLSILRRARFGRWGLPPDWVALPREGGRPAPAPGWPARFSYDAIRIPLYLSWAGLGQEPPAVGAARFWTDPRHARRPAWTDLSSDAVSPYAAPAGVEAIARLVVASQGRPSPALNLPSVAESQDYYSAVLTLLARLAFRDVS